MASDLALSPIHSITKTKFDLLKLKTKRFIMNPQTHSTKLETINVGLKQEPHMKVNIQEFNPYLASIAI